MRRHPIKVVIDDYEYSTRYTEKDKSAILALDPCWREFRDVVDYIVEENLGWSCVESCKRCKIAFNMFITHLLNKQPNALLWLISCEVIEKKLVWDKPKTKTKKKGGKKK